ncbi:MAG: hypothetical protein OHK0039_40700 [Bacteroidia bacterium]
MCLVLLLRAEQRYFYRNLYLDTQVQLVATWHDALGHGQITLHPDPADLSVAVAKSERIFMPGYGQAVYAVFRLTGDWLAAAYLVDVLALALALGALAMLARYLSLQGPLLLAWLLFLALAPAPWQYLAASDLLGLGLFLWAAVALCYRPGLVGGLLALALLGAATWVRAAYLGLLPLVPLYLLRDLRLRPWLVLGAAAAALALALLAWQMQGDSFAKPQQPGWYFAHLRHIDPFPFKAFFYYGLPHEVALAARSPLAATLLRIAAPLLSLALLAGAAYLSLRRGGRERRLGRLSALTLALVLAMLAWLSLRWPPETWNWTGHWTFVMETRYYAPAMCLLLVLLFGLAAQGGGVARLLRAWVLLAVLVNAGFGLYWQGRLLHDRSGTFDVAAERAWLALAQTLQRPGRPLLLARPDEVRLGELAEAQTLAYARALHPDSLHSSRPCDLVVALAPGDSLHAPTLPPDTAGYWRGLPLLRVTLGPPGP